MHKKALNMADIYFPGLHKEQHIGKILPSSARTKKELWWMWNNPEFIARVWTSMSVLWVHTAESMHISMQMQEGHRYLRALTNNYARSESISSLPVQAQAISEHGKSIILCRQMPKS